MKGPQREGEADRANATGSQLGGQCPHNAALYLSEPGDQPIGHGPLPISGAAGWHGRGPHPMLER